MGQKMRYAYLVGNDGARIHIDEYEDGMAITCPVGHPLIAKRGQVMAHHFAHKPGTSCDYHDNKGEWHIWWQDRATRDAQEVRVIDDGCLHIADTLVDGSVIEYQHSPMDQKTMRKRESFYTGQGYHLIWVFDTQKWQYRVTSRKDSIITIRQTQGPKFPMYAKYTDGVSKILDFGCKDLLLVTGQRGTTITGELISLSDFDRRYLGTYASGQPTRPFHHQI